MVKTMSATSKSFPDMGLHIPQIVLPHEYVDMERWSVIACDQYTSSPGYWERVSAFVGDAPSTLRLVYPECYLDSPDRELRIEHIAATMRVYLNHGILRDLPPGPMLVHRRTNDGRLRRGLVMAIDLEHYDFRPGSTSLIRPSERTIEARLPPRMDIRRDAALELPHILVLMDDPEDLVMTALRPAEETDPIYDTRLMFGAGSVAGRHIDDPAQMEDLRQAFARLADPARMRERYGSGDPLLFAVGDGNHSLATAKAVYEEGRDRSVTSLRRYALVELVNIHDPGLTFEPIHRAFFGMELQAFLGRLKDRTGCRLEEAASDATPEDPLAVVIADADSAYLARFPADRYPRAVNAVEDLIDSADDLRVDYIHGAEDLRRTAAAGQNVGVLMPRPSKQDFFRTVAAGEVLPKKSFSLGEAQEKRYYVEARRIQ